MCLRPLKKELGPKKKWIKQPINTIKNLLSNSYLLDRRKIKKKIKSVKSNNYEVRLAKNFKDIMSTTEGRKWWKNNGSGFEASIDLNSPGQIAYIEAYAEICDKKELKQLAIEYGYDDKSIRAKL